MAENFCIYIVHGTRRRLINPDVMLGDRVSEHFHYATVNGESGLLTKQTIVCHQKVRFFIPDKH